MFRSACDFYMRTRPISKKLVCAVKLSMRVVDLTLRHLLVVHRERAGAALAEAGDVVFEVEFDGVLAGSELVLRLDPILMLRLLREGIIKFRLSIEEEHSPASKAPALRDRHSFGPAFWNHYFLRDGEVFVLRCPIYRPHLFSSAGSWHSATA